MATGWAVEQPPQVSLPEGSLSGSGAFASGPVRGMSTRLLVLPFEQEALSRPMVWFPASAAVLRETDRCL